jgi:tRNA A37 methylthiotransferase MiaB
MGVDLVDLLDELSTIQKNIKYKISNLHPSGLIKLWPRLKEHLTKFSYINIPLESGSPRIMEYMYRFYDLDEVKKLLIEIKKISPDTWLFSDYIINFPSETMENIKETLESAKLYDEKRYINYSEHSGKLSESIYPKVTTKQKVERIEYILRYIEDTGENAIVCGMTLDLRNEIVENQIKNVKPKFLNN